jgi:hypothetical protein
MDNGIDGIQAPSAKKQKLTATEYKETKSSVSILLTLFKILLCTSPAFLR